MPNEDPTSGPLSDVFLEADPEMAAFMARHTALLERVTVLERAIERHRHRIEARGQGRRVSSIQADWELWEAVNG